MKTRKDNLTELRTQNSELRTQNSEDNCILFQQLNKQRAYSVLRKLFLRAGYALFVCSEIIAKTRWSKNEPADL